MAELQQRLGFWTILSLSIGSILGTTVYFGAQIGAKNSGNLTLVAWVVLSAIALYIAAVFGELSAMFPKAGGAYEFGKQAYGRFWSFLIGWVTWLVGNITVVLLVVGGVNILVDSNNLWLSIALSLFIIFLLNVVAFIGLEAGAIILVFFAIVMVGVIGAIIGRGVPFTDLGNLVPLVTHPWHTILVTMFFLAEAYFGWEAATFLAEETKNPTKVIPKALIQATALIGILGFALFVVILGIFPWQELISKTAPLTELSQILFGEAGKNIIGVGIFVTLIGSAAGGIITLPRLLLAMSRDRLFLGQFKQVHPRFKTPHRAVIFQSFVIVAILFMALGNYENLLSLLVPLAMIMYVLLILAVPVLRFKQKETDRPFKLWFGKIGPVLIALFFAASVIGWLYTVPGAFNTLMLSFSIVGIGFPLYLLVEFYYDPKAITTTTDFLAHVTMFFEYLVYPANIKKDILPFFEDVNGKTLLEFGSGVGTLSVPLLKAVGPRGKLISTHFSKNHLKITQKRIENAIWRTEGRIFGRPRLIHDEKHMSRVHPSIDYADAVVSVSMLGYLTELDVILKQLWQVLPEGGKICFIEYTNFFHILPDVDWLGNDKAIEQKFRDNGFSVKVVRKKGLLWNRVFIYGIKWEEDVAFI